MRSDRPGLPMSMILFAIDSINSLVHLLPEMGDGFFVYNNGLPDIVAPEESAKHTLFA